MSTSEKFRVLFVCTANLCRSPTAEVVLRHKLRAANLEEDVEVASCGTHAEGHRGRSPDARSTAHARLRGYALDDLKARALGPDDFERQDWIVVMDDLNWDTVARRCPPEHLGKLFRLGAYRADPVRDIPDPYYGPPEGFERVLDLVEEACDGLVFRLGIELAAR